MIQIESPPSSTDNVLATYLLRIFRAINISLSNNSKIAVSGSLPPKPVVGKLYYFKLGVIADEGVYVYKSTGWEFIA